MEIRTARPSSAGVRAPAQARGRASLERLLDAAERLIDERGLDAVTVGDIVREARASVGVFYARFEDKDALLRHLHERFCERGRAWADHTFAPERWHGVSIDGIVRALVDTLARAHADRAGLVRSFVLAACRDSSYAERLAAAGRVLSRRIRALLLARRDALSVADPERAIDFALWLVIAHHDQRAIFGAVQTSELAWSEAARRDALCRAVLAHLGAELRPSRGVRPARPRARRRGDTRSPS